MPSNPIDAKELRKAVSDGYGRTTMDLVELLPEWLKNKIRGNEEDFLQKFPLILKKVEDHWYARGQEPMIDYTC